MQWQGDGSVVTTIVLPWFKVRWKKSKKGENVVAKSY
jgi:hypothetical protein